MHHVNFFQVSKLRVQNTSHRTFGHLKKIKSFILCFGQEKIILFYSQLLALSKDLKASKNWQNTFRHSSPQNSFEVILLCNAMSSHTIPIASCLETQKHCFFPMRFKSVFIIHKIDLIQLCLLRWESLEI